MTHTFICKELDLTGNVIHTSYRSETKEDAVRLIRAKGHTPVKVEVEAEKGQDLSQVALFQPRVKTKDLIVFSKQLHTMLAAGMPLLTALDVLAEQSENTTMRATLREMMKQVQTGDVLSVTMKRHPKVFPKLLVDMVTAGELTGKMDEVLEKMAEHYTKENKINNKIKGAMIYPIILSLLVVSVVIFLLTVVMPMFVGMFTSSGVALPGPTQLLLNISDSLKGYWYLYIAVIAAIVMGFNRLKRTTGGKRAWDSLKLKLPGIRKPLAQIITTRFTRTLSTLLNSGISILDGLEASAQVTGNQVVIDGIEQVAEDIKKGSRMSVLLRRVGIFPPMMISMVSIGEESGAMEEMLGKTADYYDEELDAAIQRMLGILEPMMIIIMAVIVGFIVIAMMMPMFDMLKTVR